MSGYDSFSFSVNASTWKWVRAPTPTALVSQCWPQQKLQDTLVWCRRSLGGHKRLRTRLGRHLCASCIVWGRVEHIRIAETAKHKFRVGWRTQTGKMKVETLAAVCRSRTQHLIPAHTLAPCDPQHPSSQHVSQRAQPTVLVEWCYTMPPADPPPG